MTIELFTPLNEDQIRENRESFDSRISTFLNPFYQEFVMSAYDTSKYAHRDQIRDSGERYFEHPREVALIAIDEIGIRDSEIISTLLLHDVFEDSSLLGNAKYNTYERNKRSAMFRASRSFTSKVAHDVISVSKPKGTDIALLPKDVVEDMYHENLKKASTEAILVKACDRLHNLRTLGSTTPDKQIRKVKETVDIYFPLFEGKRNGKYSAEFEYLIDQMHKAIDTLNLPR